MKVVEAYILFSSITKHAQALDYTKCENMNGPKYKPSQPLMFKMIDFEADVCLAIKDVCTTDEVATIERTVLTGENDLTVMSEDEMRYYAKAGRAFIARGMYPVKNYFEGITVW